MHTELRELTPFTLDPARDERVPDDVASLAVPDLSRVDLSRLTRLRAVRALRVQGGFDDASLTALATALPALEHLLVVGSPRAATLASLASLTRLTSLHLHAHSGWTAEHTAAIAKLPALDALLGSPLALDEDGLARLLDARPWRELALEQFGAAGVSFARAPATLAALDVKLCGLTDEGLAAITRLASLRTLGLGHCERVTAAGLASLASLTQLHALRLWGLRALDDGAMAGVAALPSLRALDLHGVPNVTNAVVSGLASRPGFAYTGPACHAEAETLRAAASAASEPMVDDVTGDAAGAVVAARGRSAVALSALDATVKLKAKSLRAAAWQLRLDARGALAVATGPALTAWEVATGKKRATCKLPRGLTQCVALGADGALAVTVLQRTKDSLVVGWKTDEDAPAFTFAEERSEEASASLSPDGRSVAVSAANVACYELATQRERWRATDLAGAVTFTRDGAAVAVASREGVTLLDAKTGRVVQRFAYGAVERAWWILFEHDALVRDRGERHVEALQYSAIEAREDGVAIVGRVDGWAAWAVARVRGDALTVARVEEPDGSSLHPLLGLARGGDHLLVHVRGDRGAEPTVGRVSRYGLDRLFEG